MSLHPAPSPVLPASAEIPASAELPVSTEIPVSTAIPASAANPRTTAPSTQYVRVGEKAPKLSAVPTRQQVNEITQLLLSTGCPFHPSDVVHQNNFYLMETLLMKTFATDPPRREECREWRSWTNQRFCRELNIAVPCQ
jgi:uridine phosphorylase